MKNKLRAVLLGLLLCVCTTAFAAEQIMLEGKNEYNGISQKFVFQPEDAQFKQYQYAIVYFDEAGKQRKISYYLSDALQQESGFEYQEEILENEAVAEYRCFYSDKEFAKRGVRCQIEKVDASDKPYMYGFSDGVHTVYFPADFFLIQYPCYNLKYLHALFFRNDGAKGNRYVFSNKLAKGASFVRVVSNVEPLEEMDKNHINKFANFFENNQIPEIYNCKVRVSYGGNEYTVYIQKNFAAGIKKNMSCLLGYCTLGFCENLYLFATAFVEPQKAGS